MIRDQRDCSGSSPATVVALSGTVWAGRRSQSPCCRSVSVGIPSFPASLHWMRLFASELLAHLLLFPPPSSARVAHLYSLSFSSPIENKIIMLAASASTAVAAPPKGHDTEKNFTSNNTPYLPWRYKIERSYPPYNNPDKSNETFLPRILCQIDPNTFPSQSQSRKAIEYGRVCILRAAHSTSYTTLSQENDALENAILNLGIIARRDTTLANGDIVSVRTRIPNEFYPESATKYVDPPDNYNLLTQQCCNDGRPIDVLLEDDFIAIVNKPQDIDTISKGRNDLASILPFILRPPSSPSTSASSASNSNKRQRRTANKPINYYLPRPVHRLDRKTSGCVVIAKTEKAMAKFSDLFATRQVQKSYCAIVFGEPIHTLPNTVRVNSGVMDDKTNDDNDDKGDDDDGNAGTTNNATTDKNDNCNTTTDNNNNKDINTNANNDKTHYSTIDHPIDGKDAITLWRTILTITSPTWGTLSLLHLLPKTGRNHQLRRHLSYCLSCPIVGDTRYDGGGEKAKLARELGTMFLCSDSIAFRHVLLEETEDKQRDVSVRICLPNKFFEILNVSRDDLKMH